jgi:hypothetical protein
MSYTESGRNLGHVTASEPVENRESDYLRRRAAPVVIDCMEAPKGRTQLGSRPRLFQRKGQRLLVKRLYSCRRPPSD